MKNMEKLEEIHYKNGVNDLEYAPCAAEITIDVSIKFADYIAENWTPNGRKGCWDSRELNSQRESKYLVDSTQELFEEFINNHYGK
jgi:hypothetical protein